jgi:hypothetical protein
MNDSNKKKNELLGESYGTANGKLKKAILFQLLIETNKDGCFQCGNKIENIEELSVEHKIPWMSAENPIESFYDLNNISFSHLKCNSGAAIRKLGARESTPHGIARYRGGCRCEECASAIRKYNHDKNMTEEQKEYNRNYQRNRYHNDEEFRNYHIERDKKK